MKISDLIKHLESIKKEKWDLIVCGWRNWPWVWLFTWAEISVCWVDRPKWRKKLYDTVWGKEKWDFEVVYIANAREDNLEK